MKKFLNKDERIAAQSLGIKIHMDVQYYIEVEASSTGHGGARKSKAGQMELLTFNEKIRPVTGTIAAKVYNTAKFQLKQPTTRRELSRTVTKALKSELTATQISGAISYLLSSGSLAVFRPKTIPGKVSKK